MTADEWWDQRLVELKAQYGDDLWKMPKGVMAEARAEHADRLREERERREEKSAPAPKDATAQDILDMLKREREVKNG